MAMKYVFDYFHLEFPSLLGYVNVVEYTDIMEKSELQSEKILFFFHIPDFDKKHTTGVTSQQRILTHPWHMILPLS